MSQDQQSYRRAAAAALVGLFVQLLLAIAVLLLGLWAQSPALHAATWHFFGGLPIWVVLLLIYHQHRLERLERLESERLSQSDAGAAALFDEHGVDLQVARRRLDSLYKWGLGVVSVIVSLYLLVAGGVLLYLNYKDIGTDKLVAANVQPGSFALTFICAFIAFLAFIVARYVAGMTQVREWTLLRGGASYLMGNAVVALLALVGAVFVYFGNNSVLAALAIVIPAVMVLIGVEVLVTFLMSAYRPRKPGEIPRPAFDSRVLGLLTSPQSLAKTISDTLNYQFGFEVSSSWFYGLLSRSITPLIVVGIVMLLAMSCLVIVAPDEEVVITRFGRMVGAPRGPGLHFKLPWPLSDADRYSVGRVHQVLVGSAPGGVKEGAAILWTNEHVQGKEEFLVTAPTPGAREEAGGVGAEVIGGEIAVQYRIDDLQHYVTSAQDPDDLLKKIAERQVTGYFGTKTIDALVGAGRETAGEELRDLIQHDVKQAGIGLRVVFVGLNGVHPPKDQDVANAFLEQVGALQEKEATIQRAMQDAIKSMAGVAGSTDKARQIDAAIQELERIKNDTTDQDAAARTTKIAEQELKIQNLVAAAGGTAAEQLFAALAYRWERPVASRADALRFPAELAAYTKAPELYRNRVWLSVLTDGLAKPRKYVLLTEGGQPPTLRLDLKDQLNALDDLMKTNP